MTKNKKFLNFTKEISSQFKMIPNICTVLQLKKAVSTCIWEIELLHYFGPEIRLKIALIITTVMVNRQKGTAFFIVI